METIAFVEGMLNRNAGMAIGEHLGFLGQAVWTTLAGIAMLRSSLFAPLLGWAGTARGVLTLLIGMERWAGL